MRAWSLLAAMLVFAAFAVPARALVVNRVVAVVGNEPITLVQLRSRAKPHLAKIEAEVAPEKRAAVTTQMYRELLGQMIDEAVERREAAAASVTVSAEEVSRALDHVAKSQSITRDELMAAVKQHHMTQAEYEEELRRQLLTGKLIALYVLPKRPDIKGSDPATYAQKITAARRAWLDEKRANVYLDVRL